ncbi:AF4/FMR2 family member 3 isoform X2 [Hyla sarda]|nr:AF4/FMR2 family member 3 isoform X2 [Hyla sarda]XP_056411946.1 AF4/FMR2 family member 3 isoform X2 [Hyla sarda]XP_056411947.1 AF4/FMR2 family member 3 isoform X2 [Hyla sarda]XP_056411948.1 AF4/FMR2 family member 3 isoform X2 [Hyla sarda]
MKDLLTERSNQSHLVGIKQTEAVGTPDWNKEEHYQQNTTESHYSICHKVQTGIPFGNLPIKLNTRATMDWQKAENSSEGQKASGKAKQSTIGSPSTDFKYGQQKHKAEKSKSCLLNPASSGNSNDHHVNILTCTSDKPLNRQILNSQVTCSLEVDLSNKEKTRNKNSSSSHCLQNFPVSIVSKLNPIQRKPTAYVRPMDGQDQTPNESPKLKISSEFNSLFPLFRGLSNKADSEKVLNEKTETFPEFEEGEDYLHSSMGLCSQKNDDLKVTSPTYCAAQISTLEDDLKLSSDEDDCIQPGTQGQAIVLQNDSGDFQKCSTKGVSIKGSSSSSSSETDTSSESDSESESSSSESSKPSACTSPEPQHATANKWQLDKWLNKVNPNKTSILSQASSINLGGVNEGEQGCENTSQVQQASPSNRDDREDRSVEAQCTVIGNRSVKLRSPPPVAHAATVVVAVPSENTSPRRPVSRKLTRRTERPSSGENQNCHKLDDHTFSQGILGREIFEQSKSKLTCYSRGLQRKESRTTLFDCKSKQTQITKSVPKSKESHELSLQSFDHSTETELDIPPFCKNNSDLPSESKPRNTECASHNINQAGSYITQHCINRRTTSEVAPELEEQFYTLVPFGRNECSVKGSNDNIKSLWVQIDLMLLSRIPHGVHQKNLNMNNNTDKILTSSQSKCLLQATDKPLVKMRRKRKCESEGSQEMKKNPMEKEDILQFPIENNYTANSESLELSSFEMSLSKPELYLSPLPFLHDEHKPKCTTEELSSANKCDRGIGSTNVSCSRHYHQEKHTHSRQRSQPSNNTSSLSNKEESNANLWSSALNGHTDTKITKQLPESTRPNNADYFMQEAKRMKHKADAMVDKFDKVLHYTEAALAFIECGNAMEHGPMESKSPYTMYSETVELIRYALRLNSHLSHSASTQDKKITALCYRCLALLYWRMFRLKRDHAVKYSKALIDYFKNSAKGPRVPSPWNGKTTGTSSPMSPTPSPVSFQGSISSSGATSSSSSIVSIPQRIHQMAANHVSITNSILHSYDYWEIADNLAKENTEFFNELDSSMGPITLHSSMEHLVQYTRQGLSWIRQISRHVM